ncbi:MAG: histone deacetylase [Cyanobacteria bacterium J06639_1]
MMPVYYSDVFLEHLTGTNHFERPARLTSIVNALKSSPFADRLDWRSPHPAPFDDIYRVHPPEYVQAIARLAQNGGGMLDPDTPVSPRSYEAAVLAVGSWIEGTQTVLDTDRPAFVLCRPPGHHAEPDRGMGFCLFSNAAIAVLWALDRPDVERVALFDWDVHHGNGSQAVLWDNPKAAYVSIHQSPLYPGTGRVEETGDRGHICNVPMQAGSDWAAYKLAMQEKVIPFLREFDPDLLLVSAGFDCGEGDPLADIQLPSEAFGAMARMCLDVTPRCLFGLEGGYRLENLAKGWLSVAESCFARV